MIIVPAVPLSIIRFRSMSQHFSPKIVSSGLVLCYDAASIKSFRGVPGTNIVAAINNSYSNTTQTGFRALGGSDTASIPALGIRPVKYVYIYNDYATSGVCCPNVFYYFTSSTSCPVSPSTTYTYAIIYKTLTGYTHPNYMYRYEYNSSQTYLTEAGIHSTNNRYSLGDGWWYAWGQFTTQATAAYIRPYSFHYEYTTHNTVYVAGASITAGTYIHDPKHILDPAVTRGATAATGGGVIDLAGRQGAGELVNTPSFSPGGLGSFSFNGTNQIIISPENSALNTQTPTVEVWIKTNVLSQNGFFFEKGQVNTQYSLFTDTTNNIRWRQNIGGTLYDMTATTSTYLSTSSWAHIVGTYTSGNRRLYINGNLVNSDSQTGTIATNTNGISIGAYGGYNGGRGYYYNGEIGMVRVYDRVLSAAEVKQNFNAGRGRYGV